MHSDLGKANLVITGPYEFLADDQYQFGMYADKSAQNQLPSAGMAQLASRAYSVLQTDIGWLSSKAANWFKKSGHPFPAGFRLVQKTPVSHISATNVGPVGIVLFPQGSLPGRPPEQQAIELSLAAGRALKAKTSLVIGVSPWGLSAEKKFLSAALGVFDIILGGGEGIGFAHAAHDVEGVLWIRPDSRGRAVNVIDILHLPEPGKAHTWDDGGTFRATLEFLDASRPELPAMKKLVGIQPVEPRNTPQP